MKGKSINRAQAEAIAGGVLNNYGTGKAALPDLTAVQSILVEAAALFIGNAQQNLKDANSTATGELDSTLTFSVAKDGNTYVLSVGYPESSKGAQYYDYVNKGVAGLDGNKIGATGPYKFRFAWVTKNHATAIMLWLRTNRNKSFSTSAQRHTLDGVETKSMSLRKKVSEASSTKSLAYAIAASTKQKGIKPTHFFDNAVKDTFNEQFMEAMSVALGAQVRLEIKQLFKDVNNS